MKPMLRLFFVNDDGEKVFGEGPYRLLKGIEATGSMRCSANDMQMAYSKALRILKRAEDAIGAPLTERAVGGRDGGGSRLTPAGKELITRYEAYRSRCQSACDAYWHEFFDEFQNKNEI